MCNFVAPWNQRLNPSAQFWTPTVLEEFASEFSQGKIAALIYGSNRIIYDFVLHSVFDGEVNPEELSECKETRQEVNSDPRYCETAAYRLFFMWICQERLRFVMVRFNANSTHTDRK